MLCEQGSCVSNRSTMGQVSLVGAGRCSRLRGYLCSSWLLICLLGLGFFLLVVSSVLPKCEATVGLDKILGSLGGLMLGVGVSLPLSAQWENIWRPILVALALPVIALIGAWINDSPSLAWIFPLVVALVGSVIGVFFGRLCAARVAPEQTGLEQTDRLLQADDELVARFGE